MIYMLMVCELVWEGGRESDVESELHISIQQILEWICSRHLCFAVHRYTCWCGPPFLIHHKQSLSFWQLVGC